MANISLTLKSFFFFSFLFQISVNAFLPTNYIDLLEALELPKNSSRYMGVTVTDVNSIEKQAIKLGKDINL